MITLKEISTGIIKVLREQTDIEYITQEDMSSTEQQEFLHIQLIPLKSAPAAAGHFVDRQIFVDIAYMEKLHTSNARIYEVLDMLDAAFKPFFRIKDRAFSPPAQMDITDDIGHYKMTLEFTDVVPQEEGPLMEHLAVRFH
ncbi:MAG: hypothetical protein OSJ71_17185 [Acetatifactor sp.]|nr:hypothetical protein [Acetatifactor sp.]